MTEQQLEIINKRAARSYAFLRRWGYLCTGCTELHDTEFNQYTAGIISKLYKGPRASRRLAGYLLIVRAGTKNAAVAAIYERKEQELEEVKI